MIHLTYSNRTEDLLDALARDLAGQTARRHPLDPTSLVLPDRNLEAWLKQGLARQLGIAANLEIHYLRRFVAALLQRAELPPLLDGGAIHDGLLSLFLDADFLASEGLEPVRAYLLAGGASEGALARRRHQLSRRLALLFEEYGYARPQMIADWEGGVRAEGAAAWQRALWLELRRRKEGHLSLPAILERLGEVQAPEEPIYLFGISHVAHAFHRIFARLAEEGELHVYTLNPCQEFWEDLPTVREARRGYGLLEEEDPFGLEGGEETPLLSLWGRPGRENIRLLNALTDCDFRGGFSRPEKRSLLHEVQDDILHRRPERKEPAGFEGDRSIEVLAAPGIRREAEAIAARIWELVSEDPSLRFNEIAVAVAGREPELYFSHLVAAFEESYDIPYSLSDTSMLARSEVGKAVEMLLDLLLGGFERERMLRLLTHPCVRARYPEADPEAWVRLVDRLGIFLGADRGDLEGTYVEEDALNWDQGLRRVALGAVLPGGKVGAAEVFATEQGEAYLPEEAEESGRKFAALTRSLLSDLRFARGARLGTAAWSQLLDALAKTYVIPRSERERQHLDRCLEALRRIGELSLEGREIGCALAVELAKEELGKLPGGVGRYLAEGVAVSTLQPMRAIPFKMLFVVGLGEGLFPSSDKRDPLDLRLLRFQPGDVSPRERDQYMFLEALLCARERLVLSYVARDEQTGEPLPPSPVLQSLLAILEKGYTGTRDMVRKIPLRHWESEQPHPAPRAVGERWAAKLHAQAGKVGRLELDELFARLPEADRASIEGQLGIIRLEGEETAEEEAHRLGVITLRKFLECPLQGSARALAGIREDEDDLADRPREPFQLDFLASIGLLRDSMAEWLRSGRALEEILEERGFSLRSRGRAPAGIFEAYAKARHLSVLKAWAQSFEGERPRVAVHRFGPGREDELAEQIHAPLRLEGGRSLLLEGRTALLSLDDAGARASLLFATGVNLKPPSLERTLLRAFFDHLLLAAAGLGGEAQPHLALRFALDGSGPAQHAFAPLSRERAQRYLAMLSEELLEGPCEHFLPCEAYFDWRRRLPKDPELRLTDEIEKQRSSFARPASRYGPLRDSQSYPAPDEEEARTIYERRFGLFFELLGGAGKGGEKR